MHMRSNVLDNAVRAVRQVDSGAALCTADGAALHAHRAPGGGVGRFRCQIRDSISLSYYNEHAWSQSLPAGLDLQLILTLYFASWNHRDPKKRRERGASRGNGKRNSKSEKHNPQSDKASACASTRNDSRELEQRATCDRSERVEELCQSRKRHESWRVR